MKNVKMNHFIWQWTVDSLSTRKWTYYPTALTGFVQHNAYDAVGTSLAEAKAAGLQVWLGLNWTDDWWNKAANDEAWLTNEFDLSNRIIDELWSHYGATYGSTIAGFYLTMEVDNVNFQSTLSQDRMAAVYKSVADHSHTATGKPVMIAPFFNSTIGQDPQAHAAMWARILTTAPIDVVAVQDGICRKGMRGQVHDL